MLDVFAGKRPQHVVNPEVFAKPRRSVGSVLDFSRGTNMMSSYRFRRQVNPSGPITVIELHDTSSSTNHSSPKAQMSSVRKKKTAFTSKATVRLAMVRKVIVSRG